MLQPVSGLRRLEIVPLVRIGTQRPRPAEKQKKTRTICAVLQLWLHYLERIQKLWVMERMRRNGLRFLSYERSSCDLEPRTQLMTKQQLVLRQLQVSLTICLRLFMSVSFVRGRAHTSRNHHDSFVMTLTATRMNTMRANGHA